MHFLETISGQSGEQLVSAVAKYLIINSAAFRESLADLVATSGLTAVRIPSFQNGYVCVTEQGTESKDERGRLDIVVYTDNIIVGIESKLWANFQAGQPGKYGQSLKDWATEDPRYDNDRGYVLLVVAPEQRKRETKDVIDKQDLGQFTAAISWEDWLSTAEQKIQHESSDNQFVFRMLGEHLDTLLGRREIALNKVIGKELGCGNPYQSDLMYALRNAVFLQTGRMGAGKEHMGFGFHIAEDSNSRSGWFGLAVVEGVTQMLFEFDDDGNLPDSVQGLQLTADRPEGRIRYVCDPPQSTLRLADWIGYLRETLNPFELHLEIDEHNEGEPSTE